MCNRTSKAMKLSFRWFQTDLCGTFNRTFALSQTEALVTSFTGLYRSPLSSELSFTYFHPPRQSLSSPSVTLPLPHCLLCTWCRQRMNVNSSVMHRLHFDQMGLLSTLWERLELAPVMPPALVKWDVSPLCVPSNTGGFCVCVCVSKWSWGRSSESASAWFASLHTNAAQCQSFIQKHSPTDSCCNILYDEKEEGGHPPWVSKLICPPPILTFPR